MSHQLVASIRQRPAGQPCCAFPFSRSRVQLPGGTQAGPPCCRSAAVLSDLSNVRNITSTPAKAKAGAVEARTPVTRQPLPGTPGSTTAPLPQEEGSTFKTRKQVMLELTCCTSLTSCTLCGATCQTLNLRLQCQEGSQQCRGLAWPGLAT